MIAVPGYRLTEKIYQDAGRVLWQGVREKDNRPVIIKKHQAEYPTVKDMARIAHEYEILKHLNLKGVPKPLALEKYANGMALIIEYMDGFPLKSSHASIKRDLNSFFTIAVNLIEILDQLHRNNIIHKHIRPWNILVNRKTLQVWLTDFTIASFLPRENLKFQNSDIMEGSLAYISPEQTGRMNRAVDYRSDYYSLGVILYEILTGTLPFRSTDPLKLVHSHLARQAVPPSVIDPNIPPAISQIVIKLMAKTAETRYQSGRGIKGDLLLCQQQFAKYGTIDDFEIGSRDISEKLHISPKLYGRDKEINTLLSIFERASRGSLEMCMVSGHSGIGKTSLVQELYKPITQKRGYFISGKFELFHRNVPYNALVQAFQELVRQLLTESRAALEQWREELSEVLGPDGQLIIDVIPDMEIVIGPQPIVRPLKAAEARNRFNRVFLAFIRLFCKEEHPLIIFLDDLQWIDMATLRLLELILLKQQCDRDELAALNLMAGRKARASAAFEPAFSFFQTGIELLDKGSWQDQYEMSLNLYTACTETAHLCGRFPETETLAATVMKNARTVPDQVGVYISRIQSCMARNRLSQALGIALKILGLLGEPLRRNPRGSDIQHAFEQAMQDMEGKSIEDLRDLPAMTDPPKLAAMRILTAVTSAVYIGSPKLFPLVACKQVSLSVKYGNTPDSACSYCTFGVVLCGLQGDIESGYRFGKLALNVMERFDARELESKILHAGSAMINHWQKHLRETLDPAIKGYHSGVENGDFEFAGYGVYCYIKHCILFLTMQPMRVCSPPPPMFDPVIPNPSCAPPFYTSQGSLAYYTLKTGS